MASAASQSSRSRHYLEKRKPTSLKFNDGWTYIEVKTRNEKRSRRRNISFRQGILRELMRLRAHSLNQLPRKESSLVVLSTSTSPDRREAISKITVARSFRWRIFKEKNDRVIGVMIFAPFRSPKKSPIGWRYASTLIPTPNGDNSKDRFEKLMSVQL